MEELTTPQAAGSKTQNADGLDFLDFLFTFVLGFALIPETFAQKGPLSEGWFDAGHQFSTVDWERIGTLILGLVTLTLSWAGYHASIRRQPLNLDVLSGLFRFQLDVILILLYGLLLLNYKNFSLALWIVVLVFTLFIVWDFFKARELDKRYLRPLSPNGEGRKNYRRELVTLIWSLATFLLAAIYLVRYPPIVVCCGILILISFMYRIHKIRPWRQLEAKLRVRAW